MGTLVPSTTNPLVPGDGVVGSAPVGGMLLLEIDTDRTPWAGPMESSILGEGSEMSKDSVVVSGEDVEVSVSSRSRMSKSVMAWRLKSVRTWGGVLEPSRAEPREPSMSLQVWCSGLTALLAGLRHIRVGLRGVKCLPVRGIQVLDWIETSFLYKYD